jgi:predicted small lipoprotein YifL
MNRRLALALIVLSLLLSACGNKGPLVLPDNPDQPAPVPADAAAPPSGSGQGDTPKPN